MTLLTTNEVAKLLRVCPETVRRYIRSGKIPAVKVGNQQRINISVITSIFAKGTRTMPFILTPIEAKTLIPPGQYQGVFAGIEETETKKGKAWKWAWKLDNEKTLIGFTDCVQPTKANKVGRWLVSLSGQPLEIGLNIDADNYKGQRYTCIVAPHEGKTRLETFWKM